MRDNQIYQILFSTVNRIIADQAIIYPELQNALVRQSYQPTQQSATNKPCIFISKITNPQTGWGLNYVDNNREQIQYAQSTYQFTALYQQTPENIAGLTANDLATLVSDMLQSYDIIRSLTEQGLSIQRVRTISGGYFVNEKERFELDPGFEVILNYCRTYNKLIDHVDDAIGNNYGV